MPNDHQIIPFRNPARRRTPRSTPDPLPHMSADDLAAVILSLAGSARSNGDIVVLAAQLRQSVTPASLTEGIDVAAHRIACLVDLCAVHPAKPPS